MNPFGQWLSQALADRNLSQMDLSRRVGVSQQYINDMIRGRRTLPKQTLLRVTDAIGADPNWPCYLAGHIPPAMDDMHPDDFAALMAVLEARKQIWTRKAS